MTWHILVLGLLLEFLLNFYMMHSKKNKHYDSLILLIIISKVVILVM